MTTRLSCTWSSGWLPPLLALGIAVLCTLASTASATSVAGVSMAEMLQRAALVFEGRVTGARATEEPGTGIIHTEIRFEILSVLKGDYAARTIELSFLGGAVGNRALSVGEMHFPEEGERGVYFVESPHQKQANPFYGWAQGHFIIVTDTDGIERVLTRSRRPVAAIEPGPATRALSHGTALGVTTAAHDAWAEAMTTAAFKQRLSEMMRALR